MTPKKELLERLNRIAFKSGEKHGVRTGVLFITWLPTPFVYEALDTMMPVMVLGLLSVAAVYDMQRDKKRFILMCGAISDYDEGSKELKEVERQLAIENTSNSFI